MRSIGSWLVPSFVIVVGILLLLDGSLLLGDANQTFPSLQARQGQGCQAVNGSAPPPCASLSPCQEECSLAYATGTLGAVTLAAGVTIAGVRWSRGRARRSRPTP